MNPLQQTIVSLQCKTTKRYKGKKNWNIKTYLKNYVYLEVDIRTIKHILINNNRKYSYSIVSEYLKVQETMSNSGFVKSCSDTPWLWYYQIQIYSVEKYWLIYLY